MSMHRRPLGRGRTMAAIGGGLMVVGCVLPWWQVGGTPGIPAVSGNGLAGPAILVFLVGIATSNSTMISATSHGVMETAISDSYWGSHYVGARRV